MARRMRPRQRIRAAPARRSADGRILVIIDNQNPLLRSADCRIWLRAAGPRVKFSRQNGTTIKKLEALQAVVERLAGGKLADRLLVGIW